MMKIDFSRLRFLVVDDSAHMRRIVRTLLYGFGVRDVHEAGDGATALVMFMQSVPDIVITDWEMPIIDGLEFTQMIRQPDGHANPRVPIIMVTAYCEKKHVVAARDAGVTEFLIKPLSAKALRERILSVVLHPRPFIQTKSYFGPDRRRSGRGGYVGEERRNQGEATMPRRAEPPETVTLAV